MKDCWWGVKNQIKQKQNMFQVQLAMLYQLFMHSENNLNVAISVAFMADLPVVSGQNTHMTVHVKLYM